MASHPRAGADRPTLDTVAAAAGVSRMTVSNAYNRPDQLSAATRRRVLEVAGRLGYAGPNPTAASLRLGRTGTVGVMLTEQLPSAFADPGLILILHGIATELSAAGNALLLVPTYGADGASLLRHALIDALILCSLSPDDPAVAAAVERRAPLVTVGYPRLARVPCVGPDNRAAAAGMAAHLLELGHRRCAVLTTVSGHRQGPARPIFGDRVNGFSRAIGAAAQRNRADARRTEIAMFRAADNTREAGRAALRSALARAASDRPTAIFAVTDILALGALDAAREAGLSVPGELSVAGYDDIAEAATSTPALTTVAHDLFGQGRIAARLARRIVDGESVRAPRLRATVVARASTGPAPPG
ncbi:LacI family DNA-binding transcriptional regulator [uncultured Jatrophihabitans sp.]|uniref:LacI family DNA-binding transcriptional regulator n=1 Tax=uncultured Jatrophihabitans sp. TaxID=1610747 RepID=UPI0035CB2753